MSGARRRSQYRKNVTSDFLTGFPEPIEGLEYLAKILSNRGGNIFLGILSDGREEAIYMPNKFKVQYSVDLAVLLTVYIKIWCIYWLFIATTIITEPIMDQA